MVDITPTLAVKLSAATFLHITKTYSDSTDSTELKKQIDKFTPLAKEHLIKHPITCYVKNKNLGKSRVVTSEEAISILEQVEHIDDDHQLSFLKSLSLIELEKVELNVLIKPYNSDDISEHLRNMMFFTKHIKAESHSGKIDFNLLEKKFKACLPRGKKISDFIDGAKKYSYTNFLNISFRNTSVKGGSTNASK